MQYNNFKEYEAKSVEEAIAIGLEDLSLGSDEVQITIIRDPSEHKFFGFALKAKVKISFFDPNAKRYKKRENQSEKSSYQRDRREKPERRYKEEDYVKPKQQEVEDFDFSTLTEEVLAGRDFINKILSDLELDASVRSVSEEDDVVSFDLFAENPRVVIGRNGVLLESLQALVYMVVNKNQKDWRKILIDVDFYRQRREKRIRENISRIAYRVKKTRKPYLTPSYSPYDRRIIHMVIQDMQGVESESEGNGLFKKVWIKPL